MEPIYQHHATGPISASNLGAPSGYAEMDKTDSSRINMVIGRLKCCQEIAGSLAVNMSVELDRILGSVPTSVGAENAKGMSHAGSINQLDDLVSGLIETLERLSNQTQRLSSI